MLKRVFFKTPHEYFSRKKDRAFTLPCRRRRYCRVRLESIRNSTPSSRSFRTRRSYESFLRRFGFAGGTRSRISCNEISTTMPALSSPPAYSLIVFTSASSSFCGEDSGVLGSSCDGATSFALTTVLVPSPKRPFNKFHSIMLRIVPWLTLSPEAGDLSSGAYYC